MLSITTIDTDQALENNDIEMTGDEPLFGDGTNSVDTDDAPLGEPVEPLLADTSDDTAMDTLIENTVQADDMVTDTAADSELIWLINQTDEVETG